MARIMGVRSVYLSSPTRQEHKALLRQGCSFALLPEARVACRCSGHTEPGPGNNHGPNQFVAYKAAGLR